MDTSSLDVGSRESDTRDNEVPDKEVADREVADDEAESEPSGGEGVEMIQGSVDPDEEMAGKANGSGMSEARSHSSKRR